MTASLLTPEHELSPAEWLRRFALTRMKYSADKEKLLEIAGLMEQTEQVRDMMGHHLEKIANAIKGTPDEGCMWGFDDLPELCEKLAALRPDAEGAVH